MSRGRRRLRGPAALACGVATLAAIALAASPAQAAPSAAKSATLSGTVTDGSGHKWPLYAEITVGGNSNVVYTNPYSGQYSVSLAEHASYTLTVAASGYTASTTTVRIGAADKTKNIKLDVDQAACDAPGYAWDGVYADFQGWGSAARDGWTDVDDNGSGIAWDFDDDSDNYNQTGGTGNYAEAGTFGSAPVDTSLISPVVNLSKQADPQIVFDTDYWGDTGVTVDVDLSVDGGETWSNVWQLTTGVWNTGPVTIAIPQAAGKAHAQIRFHYTSTGVSPDVWLEVDNVWIGGTPMSCVPARGGLIEGVVTDASTGDALDGATVTSSANASQTATTADSPGAGDGFYELFAAATGSQQLTAADSSNHSPDTGTATVAANAITQQDFALQPGLAESAGSLSATAGLGNSVTRKLTLTNDGTEPVQVTLGQQDEGSTLMGGTRQAAAPGAPLQRIKGHFSPASAASIYRGQAAGGSAAPATVNPAPAPAEGHMMRPGSSVPADTPWATIADYPEKIMDNAVAYDQDNDDLYSVGGLGYIWSIPGDQPAPTSSGYVYDPATGSWSQIANAPAVLEAATAQFIDGTMYVVGGWSSSANYPLDTTYAYAPSSNSWAQVADLPQGVAGAASAVVDGQLYVVGGCSSNCDSSYGVYSYDPASNTWTQRASYPAGPVSYASCAGLGGKLVCAGGVNGWTNTSYDSTWIFDPGSNTWTQGATMPYDDWGAAYAGAGGMLEIADGVTDNSTELTNQASAYDPSSNTWTALPNANTAEYRGGSGCGLYVVGGGNSSSTIGESSEVLPGYDYCGPSVPWLSESQPQFTVAAGQSVQVTVTLDSGAVSQPGTYAAELTVGTNTPYAVPPVTVSMQVNPPKSWGEITGTVTDAGTGDPVGGATVQVCTQYDTRTGGCGPVTYTLTTGGDGSYELWLAKGYDPLALNVSADGYEPVVKIARVTAGGTTTVNVALDQT